MPDNRLLARPERQWRAAITLGWPLGIGATMALMALDPLPICAFRHLSGRLCPLCGATHACAALLDGNLAAAWQANPGVLPLLAVAAVHTSALALEACSGRRIGSKQLLTMGWTGAFAMLLAAWILRLLGLAGTT